MNLSKALRDRWVQAQFVLLVALGAAGPMLSRWEDGALARLGRSDPWPVRVAGIVLSLIGVAFAGWSARTLGPALTPEPEPLPEARLVERGPYRIVRHPIYTGVVLALSGWTLAWSNWMLALFVGVVLAGFLEAKAAEEERWLHARFPGYADFARRVRRRVVWADSARKPRLP